mgnify:CR=1 FL=1
MIKSILTVVFGILLLLAFIALIVWSVQVSKEKMANKRSRRTTAVKKKYEEALEGDTEADMGYWYNKEDMKMAMRSPVSAANIISTNWKNVSMIWLWKCMTAVWCEPKSSI